MIRDMVGIDKTENYLILHSVVSAFEVLMKIRGTENRVVQSLIFYE